MQESKRADFVEYVNTVMDTAKRLKIVMGKKGLRAARCNCPVDGCGGVIHAALHGKKDHLHFKCDGTCGLMMME